MKRRHQPGPVPAPRTKWLSGQTGASIGTSHFPSLVDVILGTFRYAISHRDGRKREMAKSMLQQLRGVCPTIGQPGKQWIPEEYIFQSPRTIKAEKYQEQYRKLYDFLLEAGLRLSIRW